MNKKKEKKRSPTLRVPGSLSESTTAQGTMTLLSVLLIIHEPTTTLSYKLSLGRDVSAREIVDIVLH